MNARGLRRYVDDLLRGRRPKPFRPDDFDAAQIRTAIDLQSARLGSDAPRQEFLADLRRRLAAQLDGTAQPAPKPGATRRHVIVGTSAAAAAAVAAVSIDRSVIGSGHVADGDNSGGSGELSPNTGRWMRVAASADVPDGAMRSFDTARLSDSSAVSTASSKPCRECAPIKGAGCGSTHPMTGCAAHAIRHRFRPLARC
jgi:cytochrome b6-f complex iron-sulfur subunit